MKRSPVARKTPLARGTSELKRTPLAPGCTQLRRTPINPVSAKQKAMYVVRRVSEAALGRKGLEGLCARCCRFGYVNGHELRNRSHGGDAAHPDCLLCPLCNEQAENGDRRLMVWTGWKIDPRYPHDPRLEVGQAVDLFGNIVTFTTEPPGAVLVASPDDW